VAVADCPIGIDVVGPIGIPCIDGTAFLVAALAKAFGVCVVAGDVG
jgi:hypothetical protein